MFKKLTLKLGATVAVIAVQHVQAISPPSLTVSAMTLPALECSTILSSFVTGGSGGAGVQVLSVPSSPIAYGAVKTVAFTTGTGATRYRSNFDVLLTDLATFQSSFAIPFGTDLTLILSPKNLGATLGSSTNIDSYIVHESNFVLNYPGGGVKPESGLTRGQVVLSSNYPQWTLVIQSRDAQSFRNLYVCKIPVNA
jgi:hypothetical protein